jgi:hypothetical protein
MANTRNDDDALIEADTTPSQGGGSGGNLAAVIGSRDELASVEQPEGYTRVTKQDDIDHAAEERPDRARAPDRGT